jgi:hypothetical protein
MVRMNSLPVVQKGPHFDPETFKPFKLWVGDGCGIQGMDNNMIMTTY